MYAPQVYPAVFPLSAVSAKDVSSVSAGFSACPSCEAGAGASVRQQEMTPRTCKKLVASAWRREGVYNRTGEPSVTFCAKEELRRACALIFVKKIGVSDTKLAPTCLSHMKMIFPAFQRWKSNSCVRQKSKSKSSENIPFYNQIEIWVQITRFIISALVLKFGEFNYLFLYTMISGSAPLQPYSQISKK